MLNHTVKKVSDIFLSIFIGLFIISFSAQFTLCFKPLYYYDINNLKISKTSKLSYSEIKDNYNYIINYLTSSTKEEFKLPSLPSSKEGAIHFEDVRNIFYSIRVILFSLIIMIAILATYKIRRKDYNFINYSFYFLVISLLFILSLTLNFDRSFNTFHKLLFRNDYWLFDPLLDPVISILPQEFFMHSALLIALIIVISCIALKVIYHKISKK